MKSTEPSPSTQVLKIQGGKKSRPEGFDLVNLGWRQMAPTVAAWTFAGEGKRRMAPTLTHIGPQNCHDKSAILTS